MKIMIVDGNSIISRAFYAMPTLSNSKGVYTGGVYGFLNIIFKLLDEEKPECLAVTFDLPLPTFRHKKYVEYKANRKQSPDELQQQIPLLKQVLSAMNIQRFELEGYEGDDLLGTIAKKAQANDIIPVIISGDRDLLQLATDTVKVRIPKTKGNKTEIEDYYADDVKLKYGVTPEEYIDVKALMGDSSDNIPGVESIGEKTATKIIQQYHCIEEAIKNAESIKPKRASENLQKFKDIAILSKDLATIDTDAPIKVDFEKTKLKNIMTKEAYNLFKELEFKSFLDKFNTKEEVTQLTLNFDSSTIADKYIKISDLDEAKNYIKLLENKKNIAYIIFHESNKLIGISFCYEAKASAWIEVNDNIKEDILLKLLKPFFEAKDNSKIAHNQKDNISFLRKHNINLNGVIFDTTIAGYILNPTRETYHYDDLANEFLSENYISEQELLGKNKSKKSLLDIDDTKRVNFACRYVDIVYRVMPVMNKKLMDNEQKQLYYSIEQPLIEVLASMEKYGIKINELELIKYGENLTKSIDELTKEIYSMAGEEFNINSPKQLGVILFEKLGLESEKKTKTGYSTAADVLERLAYDNLIVKKILDYRTLAKLKSTYVDGLLAVMDKSTHRIYSTFNQTITATGRISSTEPNLQNIPIKLDLGRELRKVFVPENEDFIFVDADYSQIELRVLAHLSDDETLINAFCHNQDIHKLTASQVFKIPFDEVTSKQRSNAKAVNFGIVYGIGAFSLSKDLNITRQEAERYIEGYFEKYPKVKIYLDKLVEDARQKGYAETIFNRRRIIPEINAKNFSQRSFGERVAMNMPIQGSAADIIKIAMVKVYQRFKKENLKSRLILQVHDELLVEAKKDEINIVKEILKYEMEHTVDFKVPMLVDMHEGNTWFETK